MPGRRHFGCAWVGAVLADATAAGQNGEPDAGQADPRYGLLSPIPDRGGVPPIVDLLTAPSPDELASRAASRRYAEQIRAIRHRCLGDVRVEELRRRGIEELTRLTDPDAFMPLVEELARERDDVRLAILDHFASCGEPGQAALAWVAVHDEESRYSHEAIRRLSAPPSDPVLRVLDDALRSETHATANRAGTVAGALSAIRTIPLLIFAQATADPVEDEGDLAWILVGTSRSFVARVEPVVGSGVGAFQPIPGVIQDGSILRVVDAVAIFYRTEVHRALVSITTDDWGRSTAHFGYDIREWWRWYNAEYLPFKNEQILQARLAE